MKILLPNDQAIIQEAMQILNQTLKPSQMIVLITRWWSDGGDYLHQRDQLFNNETIDSLTQKIQAYEQQNPDPTHSPR